jgi:hypothetical protein
VAQHED